MWTLVAWLACVISAFMAGVGYGRYKEFHLRWVRLQAYMRYIETHSNPPVENSDQFNSTTENSN